MPIGRNIFTVLWLVDGVWRAYFIAADWSELWLVTLRPFTRRRSRVSNHINYSHMCIVVSSEDFLELLIGQSSDKSRYDRWRGKGAAPTPIINPASWNISWDERFSDYTISRSNVVMTTEVEGITSMSESLSMTANQGLTSAYEDIE